MILVVFKLQPGETTNAYSLVDEGILRKIPPEIILKTQAVDTDIVPTKEKCEELVKELLND